MSIQDIRAARTAAINAMQLLDDERAALLLRVDGDIQLAAATTFLLNNIKHYVTRSEPDSEPFNVPVALIDQLQPLAQSYGATLKPYPASNTSFLSFE